MKIDYDFNSGSSTGRVKINSCHQQHKSSNHNMIYINIHLRFRFCNLSDFVAATVQKVSSTFPLVWSVLAVLLHIPTDTHVVCM